MYSRFGKSSQLLGIQSMLLSVRILQITTLKISHTCIYNNTNRLTCGAQKFKKHFRIIKATFLDKKCCTVLLTGHPPREFGTMVTPPPTPHWSMLFSWEQKCSSHTSTLFFWGGGGSILSKPGFRGKCSKIRHRTCIFLNIFVQNCSNNQTIKAITQEVEYSHSCQSFRQCSVVVAVQFDLVGI